MDAEASVFGRGFSSTSDPESVTTKNATYPSVPRATGCIETTRVPVVVFSGVGVCWTVAVPELRWSKLVQAFRTKHIVERAMRRTILMDPVSPISLRGRTCLSENHVNTA